MNFLKMLFNIGENSVINKNKKLRQKISNRMSYRKNKKLRKENYKNKD